MIFRFIMYGLLGWNIEVIWTGFCSLVGGDVNMIGHTSVWMFFIYGAGGMLFEAVRKKILDRRWYERGLIWMYLIFAIEFISGACLKLIGIIPWNYKGLFSVAGLIRLDYAPLWFAVGLMFEKIYSLALTVSNSYKRG